MAKGAFITQKKYDDVKRLIEANFKLEEIAGIAGVSRCTAIRIKRSKNLEEYKMIAGGKLPKSESVSEEKQLVGNNEQMEKLNNQMKGLQESMNNANNTLNAIYDILKRYMEV